MKRAAAAALFATGCSFIIVGDRQKHDECGPATPALDYAAPVLDTVVAAAGATATYIETRHGLLPETSPSCNQSSGNAICPVFAVFAVIGIAAYAVSAAYGFAELHACRSRPARIVGP